MLKTLISIYSLLLAVAILLLGSGLLGTTVALRADMEQYSETLTGFIMSGFFLGYVFGSYICPRMVRAVGHIRAFAVLAAVGCVGALLHGLWVHPLVWWLLRLVTGISMLGLYLVIESWLNGLAQRTRHGSIFAVYMTVNLFALAASQYLILVYGAGGVAPFALVAIFFALGLIPVAMTRLEAPSHVAVPQLGLKHLYGISPLGATGALISGLLTGALWGVGPLFGRDLGLGAEGVAWFMGAVVFGGALLQWPIGHLSDRYDRRKVLTAVSLAGAAAAGVTFLLAGENTPGVLVSALVYGGFSFSVYSLSVAHANDHLEPEQVLTATRGLLLLSGIGATLGPLLAGVVMELLTPFALMAYLGVMLAGLAAFALWRMGVSPPVALEAQSEFVPMARTSPAVLEIDPRTETAPEREESG
jgi:MFS family permease